VRSFLLGFVAGTLLLQCLPALPWVAWPLMGAVCCLGGWAASLAWQTPHGWRLLLLALAAGLLGFAQADLRAHWRLADTLPEAWEGQDLLLTGTIIELPQAILHGARFVFQVEQVSPEAAVVPHRISLAWFDAGADNPIPELHPGQRWQLLCRLRRPHGVMNPGGFDFESWSFAQGIRASGSVRAADDNHLLGTTRGSLNLAIEQLRDNVRERIRSVLGNGRWTGVLVALVVGDQSGISQEDWQLFWQTGVGHLISISGLHITMLSGLAAAAAGRLWPSIRVRWLAALAGAMGYSLLAGFSVPTQRTLYMIAVLALGRFRSASLSASMLLAAALAVAVAVDPWAPLSVGFWLSFGAVAALMYAGAHGVGRESALKTAVKTQWAATWSLVPLLMLLFQQVSLVSPLANAFAIPVVSLGVVPLALAGVLPGVGWALNLAHQLFAICAWLLEILSRLPSITWSAPQPSLAAVAAGMAGLLFLLAPAGLPGRRVGASCLAALLLAPAPHPEEGGVRMDVLDVGQGLSVVIRTRSHALVYDTGPRYSAESDGGARVLLPALRSMGVSRLDGLVVSHRDADHSGGGESLQKGMTIGWLLSSLEPGHPLRMQARQSIPCFAGQSWLWDSVTFEILHPLLDEVADESRKTNDRGCVLRIVAEGYRLLLPADIEALSEQELLGRSLPGELAADVLVVPHHGSRTSSTAEFLDAVSPRWAIFTVGYRNRFGHPKPDVVQRYAERPIQLLRTDANGAVHVSIEKRALGVSTERARFPHYWEDVARPFP
jgi:competence protein ComEC